MGAGANDFCLLAVHLNQMEVCVCMHTQASEQRREGEKEKVHMHVCGCTYGEARGQLGYCSSGHHSTRFLRQNSLSRLR